MSIAMVRNAYIGTNDRSLIPQNAYIIDIPAIYTRKNIYTMITDYISITPEPILGIPDTRILTSEIIKQLVSLLKSHSHLSIITLSKREEDVPYLFKYFLTPIYQTPHKSEQTLREIVRHSTKDMELVELLTELIDLGYFKDPDFLWRDIIEHR
jgi:hypothetical protein